MKSLKNLLIPFLILLALIVAIVVVFVVKDKNKPEEEPTSFQLVKCAPEDITDLTIERKDKEPLVITRVVENGKDPVFTLNTGDQSLLSQDKFTNYLKIMLDYVASNKLDVESPNLADYGLDAPECTIKINLASGENKILKIGNDVVDGSGSYIMLDGDSNIYTITTLKKQMCSYTAIDFYATIKLGIDYKDVSNVVFERKADNINLSIRPENTDDGYVFYIEEPYQIQTGAEFTNLLSSMSEFEIASFVNLTDDKVKEYGLDDPSYHFCFTKTDGSKEEFYLSKAQDGFFYGKGTMSDEYFMVSVQQLPDIDMPELNLVYDYVYYFHAYDVKEITGEFEDRSFDLTINTTGALDSEDAEVFLDGRDAKIMNSYGKCYASVFFEKIACIKIGGIALGDVPSGDPFMTIKIYDKEYKVTELSFIQKDAASYYVMKNGEYTGFFVYEKSLTKDAGDQLYSYGIIGAYDLLTTAISEKNANNIYDIPTEESSNG